MSQTTTPRQPIHLVIMNSDTDVEAWLIPYVLQDAGFDIVQQDFYNSSCNLRQVLSQQHMASKNKKNPQSDDKDIEISMQEEEQLAEISTVVVGHSNSDHEMALCKKRHYNRYDLVPAEWLLCQPRVSKLLTCYWDWHTQSPSHHELLPGWNHSGLPVLYEVDPPHVSRKSQKYLRWLQVCKQTCMRLAQHGQSLTFQTVKCEYMRFVLPHLAKYEKVSNCTWHSQPIIS